MASLSWTTLSPLPVYLDSITDYTLAARPATLDGKVLGLLPNWRPSAVHVLKALGTLLAQRYRLKAVVMEPPLSLPPMGHGANVTSSTMIEKIDDLIQRVDVVITASGD